ncbi:hypothetical protein ES332_D06G033400v1 [Gossypium tomentosum]|uniref:Uncharacterized protein n=1 Tax=Gossypium tomentosum TaxID=34277 RepID=A0A5D2KEA8_GOSTO|nr:hypothetical protein ES332_D06G033400v1 [Gossypium tomentosum]
MAPGMGAVECARRVEAQLARMAATVAEGAVRKAAVRRLRLKIRVSVSCFLVLG